VAFEDIKVHVRFKLFALWSSLMFFYIYGDYFELYQPGKLQKMIAGSSPLGSISQGLLLSMSAVMVIPSLMPFLSLVLPVGVNRWMNIVFGAVYTVIMILAIRGGWSATPKPPLCISSSSSCFLVRRRPIPDNDYWWPPLSHG